MRTADQAGALIAAVALSFPMAAQELEPLPALEIPTGYVLRSNLSHGARFDQGWLLLAEPAPDPRLPASAEAKAPVRREKLDDGSPVAFDDLPGGILFGLVARPQILLPEARVYASGSRIEVFASGTTYALPAEDPDLLASCLAFAEEGRADQALVDILANGMVLMAPEFRDTRAGLALIHCDRVPHMRMPSLAFTKSVIVDRDVRLTLDLATGELRPQADLEVRFYREVEDPIALTGLSAKCTTALPASGALAAELSAAAEVAAWIGFFRWALQVDPEGCEEVQRSLDRAKTAEVVPTPRWIDRFQPADRSGPSAPSQVKDWMRAHRARAADDRD